MISINQKCLLQVGVICNNATINGDTLQGQPTEGALLAVAMKVLFNVLNFVFVLFYNNIYIFYINQFPESNVWNK